MKKLSIAAMAILLTLTPACSKQTAATQTVKSAELQTAAEISTAPLYELAAKHGFKFGTVVNPQSIKKIAFQSMIKNDFNSITASNEFKA